MQSFAWELPSVGNWHLDRSWEFVLLRFLKLRLVLWCSGVFCWPLGISEEKKMRALGLKWSNFEGVKAGLQWPWQMAQGAAANKGSQIPPKGLNTISSAWKPSLLPGTESVKGNRVGQNFGLNFLCSSNRLNLLSLPLYSWKSRGHITNKRQSLSS